MIGCHRRKREIEKNVTSLVDFGVNKRGIAMVKTGVRSIVLRMRRRSRI
jgi:hypothetical protein